MKKKTKSSSDHRTMKWSVLEMETCKNLSSGNFICSTLVRPPFTETDIDIILFIST